MDLGGEPPPSGESKLTVRNSDSAKPPIPKNGSDKDSESSYDTGRAQRRKLPPAELRRRFITRRYRTLQLPSLPENATKKELHVLYEMLFKDDPKRYCKRDRKKLAAARKECFDLVWDKKIIDNADLPNGTWDGDVGDRYESGDENDAAEEDTDFGLDENVVSEENLPKTIGISIDNLPELVPHNARFVTRNTENIQYLMKAERDPTLPAGARQILQKANKEAKNEILKITEKLIIQFAALYGIEHRHKLHDVCLFIEWILEDRRRRARKIPHEVQRVDLNKLFNAVNSSHRELYILQYVKDEGMILNSLAKVHNFVVENGIDDIEAGNVLPKFIRGPDVCFY